MYDTGDNNKKKGLLDDHAIAFWTVVTGLVAVITLVVTLVTLRHGPDGNTLSPSPSDTSPSVTPSTPIPSSSATSPIAASQIASDVTGNTVNASRHSGATVTSATCYQNSVAQSGNGTTYAECDLTYSDGAVFRSAVTDDNGKASSQEQYQENLSASGIANYAVGDTVTSGINAGATVTSATCYTAQLETNDWTYATCNLNLSNGVAINATVEDNGIKSEFQS
jgi:hypothetical protein